MFPDGLANGSGLVGKNLMFHPIASATGVFEERLEGYMGPQGCNIVSHEFYETDTSRGFVRGYMFQCARGAGPVSTAIGVPWGVDHHSVFESRFGKMATVGVMGEDLPEEINAVTIDPDLTDSDGIPAPRVTYRMSDNSLKLMAHGVEKATEVLKAAGAVDILVNPHSRIAGWHLMGTARMGTDPAESVVDGNVRHTM